MNEHHDTRTRAVGHDGCNLGGDLSLGDEPYVDDTAFGAPASPPPIATTQALTWRVVTAMITLLAAAAVLGAAGLEFLLQGRLWWGLACMIAGLGVLELGGWMFEERRK